MVVDPKSDDGASSFRIRGEEKTLLFQNRLLHVRERASSRPRRQKPKGRPLSGLRRPGLWQIQQRTEMLSF
ncbi:hypothetical protein IF2G_09469 [Cordyceps javanica]|nr:hypothetical protein IF2G_09469 [Cordyceps javanica]